MNILLITNQLAMGGAEQFIIRLANELSERQHQVLLVSSGGELEGLVSPRVRLLEAEAQAKSPAGIWRLACHLRALVAEHDVQVIHANSPTTALAARLARRDRPIPVVTSAHNGKYWYHRGIAHVLAWVLSLGSDRVVGVSNDLTAYLVRHGLAPGKALTIHNGIPFQPSALDPEVRARTRSELGLGLDVPLILCVARLQEIKGHRYLIEAMPLVLQALPTAQLVLAGDGPCRAELEAQARLLGIHHAVHFLGNRSDVEQLLQAADVFCLPSIWEALPLAIAEAMAAELPVVATSVGGVPELVQDGLTGWIVPPRDAPLLASGLLTVLENPLESRLAGLAGRALVARQFTLERMVSAFERLYQQQATLMHGATAPAIAS